MQQGMMAQQQPQVVAVDMNGDGVPDAYVQKP